MRNFQIYIFQNEKRAFLVHHLHHAKYNSLIIRCNIFYNLARQTNQEEKVNHYQR